jgi:hypothetical protein
VLRPHDREGPKDDELEGAGQELWARVSTWWHSGTLPQVHLSIKWNDTRDGMVGL